MLGSLRLLAGSPVLLCILLVKSLLWKARLPVMLMQVVYCRHSELNAYLIRSLVKFCRGLDEVGTTSTFRGG